MAKLPHPIKTWHQYGEVIGHYDKAQMLAYGQECAANARKENNKADTVLVAEPVRVTDIEKQFPAFARALALWQQAPQKRYDLCWNTFTEIEVELEKMLNSATQAKSNTG